MLLLVYVLHIEKETYTLQFILIKAQYCVVGQLFLKKIIYILYKQNNSNKWAIFFKTKIYNII